ncbi:unnamed protein product [Periconia digitata]|uniref:Uncharacterized protein n=1 Tax=Periconia digitata TaxID=1303443 RepID=A0A9W4U4Y3_9PLEO|nr:unnamed protein product [Periconia digitata]
MLWHDFKVSCLVSKRLEEFNSHGVVNEMEVGHSPENEHSPKVKQKYRKAIVLVGRQKQAITTVFLTPGYRGKNSRSSQTGLCNLRYTRNEGRQRIQL